MNFGRLAVGWCIQDRQYKSDVAKLKEENGWLRFAVSLTGHEVHFVSGFGVQLVPAKIDRP
jgi:hypothetical protein